MSIPRWVLGAMRGAWGIGVGTGREEALGLRRPAPPDNDELIALGERFMRHERDPDGTIDCAGPLTKSLEDECLGSDE